MNDIAHDPCNNLGILKTIQIIFYFETTNVPYIEHIECKCTQNSKYTPEMYVICSSLDEWGMKMWYLYTEIAFSYEENESLQAMDGTRNNHSE